MGPDQLRPRASLEHRTTVQEKPLPCSLKLANEDKEQRLALLEEARVSVAKEAGELRASLQEVERSRLEARRELQELRRQVSACHRLWPSALSGGQFHCV